MKKTLCKKSMIFSMLMILPFLAFSQNASKVESLFHIGKDFSHSGKTILKFQERKMNLHNDLSDLRSTDIFRPDSLPVKLQLFSDQNENDENRLLLKFTEHLKKMSEQDTLLIDSIFIYTFKTPVDSFLTSKSFYTYNSEKHSITIISEIFDNTKKVWMYNSKWELYVNKDWIDTLTISSSWNTTLNDWIYSTKGVQKMDQAGNNILFEKYSWDTGTGQWKGVSTRLEFAYDRNNNLILRAAYQWVTDLHRWKGVSKQEYVFNDNSILVMRADYQWDVSSDDWIGITKEDYLFDENNNQEILISYRWDVSSDGWIGANKYERLFDHNNCLILEIQSSWDNLAKLWKNTEKEEFVYDATGFCTRNIYSLWDDSSHKWINSFRIEISGENNRPETQIMFSWNKESELWFPVDKMVLAYDSSGRLTEFSRYDVKDSIATQFLVNGFNKSSDIFIDLKDPVCLCQNCTSIDPGFVEGTGSLKWEYNVRDFNSWGGFCQIKMNNILDLSKSDGISFYFKNPVRTKARFFMVFKESDGEYWYYENDNLLTDSIKNWKQLIVPFQSIFLPGYAPSTDKIFDRDKIIQIFIEVNVLKGDTAKGTLYLDNFTAYKIVPGSFKINTKSNWAYDNHGALIYSADYYFNPLTDKLEVNSAYKSDIIYNEVGSETGNISYHWETTLGIWIPDSKRETTYDKNLITSTEQYSWDDVLKSWVGYYKIESTYDMNGKETKKIYYYWDQFSKIWIPENKFTGEYDQKGNPLYLANYAWDISTSNFRGISKTGFFYTPEAELYKTVNYSWNSSISDWIVGSTAKNAKYEYIYGPDSILFVSITENWDETGSRWSPVLKYYRYFSLHDMVTGSVGHEYPGFEEVKIYPNPSIEKINIEMQSGLTATVLITDIRGKVVRILDLKDRITTVPVSDLASGPYIIRVSMKDKVFIKKIIVQ